MTVDVSDIWSRVVDDTKNPTSTTLDKLDTNRALQ